MNKRKELKKWVHKADKAFSEYIRKLWADETYGNGMCPLCLNNKIQCCFHFIRRHRKIVRWDPINAVGSCHACNYQEKYNPDISRAWFLKLYGLERYLKLVELSKKHYAPSIKFLKRIVNKYS